MDWGSIIGGILAALVAAIGLPLALKRRKKASPENVEQFLQHLQGMGVKASLLEKGDGEEKVGVSRASGQRSEGVIRIEGKNVDFVNVISVTSQYGVQYFLDYLVKALNWTGRTKRKKTKLETKKSSVIRGKVVDIVWKGDDYLSQVLNYDSRLKDKLLQVELDKLKGSILIVPEPKYEYARVRTTYLLPSPDLFEAIDIIAGCIKSGW
jgi:hypothetical protein